MYITVASVKRSLGFKGLEISDLLIAFPFLALFLILFCCTSLKLLGLTILIIGIFALIPVKVSQKNRMYKVLALIGFFLFSVKEYTYYNAKNLRGLMLFEKTKNKGRKGKGFTFKDKEQIR